MTLPVQPNPAETLPAASSASPPAPPPAPAPQVPAGHQNGPNGFPLETPWTDMAPDQQVNYWRYQSRRHEDTAKSRADYDDLKVRAAEADRLRQQVETDAEKATREAVEQARKTAVDEFSPRLVAAEFRAASAGRIEAERLATLTDDIDMSRYLKADGSVDLEKVSAKVDAWAPTPPPPDPNAPPPPSRGVRPDPSQGPRGGQKTTGTDVGREMFENRRKKPVSS